MYLLYLPFHIEDYAIDIFPIKKMKCNFHQLLITKRKEKSPHIAHRYLVSADAHRLQTAEVVKAI